MLLIKSFRQLRERQKEGNILLWLKGNCFQSSIAIILTSKLNLRVFKGWKKHRVCICPVMKMTVWKLLCVQPLEHHSGFCYHNSLQCEDIHPNSTVCASAMSQTLAWGCPSFPVTQILRPLESLTQLQPWKLPQVLTGAETCIYHLGGGIPSKSFPELFSFLWDNKSSRIWGSAMGLTLWEMQKYTD